MIKSSCSVEGMYLSDISAKDEARHIGIQGLAGFRQQVQGIEVREAAHRRAGEGGVLLVPRAVAAVVGDIKRLEALRGLGVIDGEELVRVHVVRRAVRILGDEPEGIVLGAEAEAEHHQQQGGKDSFHLSVIV